MRTKKRESNNRKNVTLKSNAHSRSSRAMTVRGRVKTIKTAYGNKPMFDPIAGP